jgi:hypothetical protein
LGAEWIGGNEGFFQGADKAAQRFATAKATLALQIF